MAEREKHWLDGFVPRVEDYEPLHPVEDVLIWWEEVSVPFDPPTAFQTRQVELDPHGPHRWAVRKWNEMVEASRA